MPISGVTLDYPQCYGKDRIYLDCKVTIGASGAVSSVTGKGFQTTGGPLVGSVVKEATAGQYSITLPGRGSINDIQLLGAFVEHATDPDYCTIISRDLTNRKITIQFRDAAGLADDLTSTAVLHLSFMAKNSNLA